MGSPHTIDVCGNCRNPIIQWNNTGPWEHLAAGTMDQAKSRAYVNNAKHEGATICANPRLLVEQNSNPTRNTANYRTAKKV